MKNVSSTTQQRVRGAPAAALPGLISFVFLALVGPFFYAFFGYLIATASSNDTSFSPIENIFYIHFVWVVIFLVFVLMPAVSGRIIGIKLSRLIGYASIMCYGIAFAAALGILLFGTAQQHFLSRIFFGTTLIPLAPATWLLIRALANQPWFNPNANADELGPSLGA